jgi:hypothetical protein
MFWRLAAAVWLLNLNKVTVWRWFSYFCLSTKIPTSQLCLRNVNCGLTFLKTTDSSTSGACLQATSSTGPHKRTGEIKGLFTSRRRSERGSKSDGTFNELLRKVNHRRYFIAITGSR